MELEAVGVLIKEARQQAGLSQVELAERIGTYKANISRMENGKQNVTVELLNKIAKATGKQLDIQLK